ncbi:oxidoreductase [Vibrio parahaemolyticus]|uniref:oxidoreductase n=1 Tax=Vibrio parahaemolyticus TaxID=670 RepID=UPI0019178520
MYKKLFSPMRIGNCEIKNRVVMPPMHLGMANLDGTLTEKFMNYYEERAKALLRNSDEKPNLLKLSDCYTIY